MRFRINNGSTYKIGEYKIGTNQFGLNHHDIKKL
jgi:hypothetical protein